MNNFLDVYDILKHKTLQITICNDCNISHQIEMEQLFEEITVPFVPEALSVNEFIESFYTNAQPQPMFGKCIVEPKN